MALPSGARLGPYEIIAAIGAGGMGEVYKARDTRLGRDVAIKVLPASATSDPERLHRFEVEARAVSALTHPHICVLYDIGSTSSPQAAGGVTVDYLVMEYLEGATLAERLRHGALPRAQVLELGTQIAEALAAAHRHGIVHRDLKPANIMLTKAGAKLLDFGLAKLRPRPLAAGVRMSAFPTQAPATRPGVVMGTVPYMAPEQLEGGETDARTDLFAFGCVLYEMLTARRPFGGDTEASLISAIMTGEPPPLSSLQPRTPPALDRLVRRCLAKDPDDRWQSAADVAEELRGISADSVTPPPARAARAGRRRGWMVAAGAAALLLVAAALAWVTPGPFPRRPAPTYAALTFPAQTALVELPSTAIAAAEDGSGVVYVGTSRGVGQLYWHDLHGPDGWALPGTEGGTTPFLSADARWLGFYRERKILKLPLLAGRVQEGSTVSEVTAADALRGASWASDGTIVYSTMDGGLSKVAAAGGEPLRLTQPDRSKGEQGHRWPAFLPGQRHVLFTVLHASLRNDRSAIAVLSLETGRWTTVLDGGVYGRYLPSGHLVFARHGSVLAVPFDVKTLKATGTPVPVLSDVWFYKTAGNAGFDVSADGTLVYANQKSEPPDNALVWVTRGGQTELITPDRRAYQTGNAALSTDGTRLAVTIFDGRFDTIWVYDLRDRRWQELGVEADCYSPVLSPSGDRVAFASNLGGLLNLYTIAANGEGPPARLTASGYVQLPGDWSRDGRFLAYMEQGSVMGTCVLPLDDRAKPWRWLPDGVSATSPAFSPDGRWLAYQSRESGKWEVWVRPFPGPGTRQLVSGSDGGFAPAWSSDGREIFYLERLGDTRILSRRVESTSPWRLSEPGVAFALPFALANDDANQPRGYAVEPGGRRVFVVQPDERAPREISALNVITNWPEEVRAKLRAKQ